MVRKNAIKGLAFSLLSMATAPAFAQFASERSDLILIEELPPELRMEVHARVVEFFRLNPQFLDDAQTVALDSKGTIYVIDKKMATIGSAGQSTCIGQ
jgi:hypothetical protein